jgi:hypothetical protein
MTQPRYAYEITPRPANLGGGWKLTLLENGEEAGGGVFPIAEEDPQIGIDWWNGLTHESRSHWLMVSASAIPAAARHAYLLAEAYADAREEGEAWTARYDKF